MPKTTPDQNKAIVLEAFDRLGRSPGRGDPGRVGQRAADVRRSFSFLTINS